MDGFRGQGAKRAERLMRSDLLSGRGWSCEYEFRTRYTGVPRAFNVIAQVLHTVRHSGADSRRVGEWVEFDGARGVDGGAVVAVGADGGDGGCEERQDGVGVGSGR